MSTHVLRSSLALNAGGIAKIDALENEEEAQFSDDAESLSTESGNDSEESDATASDSEEPLGEGKAAIPSHLAFLAGAISSYPASGVAATSQSGDDEEDEYDPEADTTAVDIPTENVKVDTAALLKSLDEAAIAAAKAKEAQVANLEAFDDQEAEFTDEDENSGSSASEEDEEEDEGESEDAQNVEDHMRRLTLQDVTGDDEDDSDDSDYVP